MQHPKAQMSENKNNILKKILPIPIALSLTDRIIQFYKTVIELEQRKEPEIKTFYPYSCDEITPTDLLSIHLPQNEDFKKLFEENKQQPFLYVFACTFACASPDACVKGIKEQLLKDLSTV